MSKRTMDSVLIDGNIKRKVDRWKIMDYGLWKRKSAEKVRLGHSLSSDAYAPAIEGSFSLSL
jgi:hypothetical protein